jgi:hypothetical protein
MYLFIRQGTRQKFGMTRSLAVPYIYRLYFKHCVVSFVFNGKTYKTGVGGWFPKLEARVIRMRPLLLVCCRYRLSALKLITLQVLFISVWYWFSLCFAAYSFYFKIFQLKAKCTEVYIWCHVTAFVWEYQGSSIRVSRSLYVVLLVLQLNSRTFNIDPSRLR